ncbi:hypothetical protein Tco_0214809 [Tanacetum coccineum]
MIDYALWEVIENGATLPKIKIVEGVMRKMTITSAEDKAQRRLEVKARSTLMMGIPNEHQLKFDSIKDAILFTSWTQPMIFLINFLSYVLFREVLQVLKLKNIKKDGYTRFQHQKQYEHVGLEDTRLQEGKRSQDDDKRLCLVDDLKEFKITFMSS